MPRIPVYEQSRSYGAAHVQAPQVKRPVVKTASGVWDKLNWGGQISALAARVPVVSRSLDVVGNAVGKLTGRFLGQADKPAADGNAVTKQAAQASSQADFSAEDNHALRTGMIQAVQGAENPLAGLDAYAAQTWQEHFSGEGETHVSRQAFLDDYAVLRQEVSVAQEARRKQASFAAWQGDTELSVKMASLIKTPEALQAYVQSSGQRARRGAQALGLDGTAAERDFTYNALRLNMENALSCGDVDGASRVYQAFSEKLPDSMRQVLASKLADAQAQQTARRIWNTALKTGADDTLQQARLLTEELPEEERTSARRYVQLYARRAGCARARERAENFHALLASNGDADTARRVLMNTAYQDGADFKCASLAVERWLSAPGQCSTPEAFNKLYRAVHNGTGAEGDADKAFAAGAVNAPDYLALKAAFSRREGGKTDKDASLLISAAERWCRKNGLDEQTAQTVKYQVFAARGGTEEKWAELSRIKKRLAD